MRPLVLQYILNETPKEVERRVSRWVRKLLWKRGKLVRYRLFRERKYIDKNLLFSYQGKLSTPYRIFSKKHFKHKRR